MKPAGRVVFVTHGGARIGLGHVKRCLALAKALAEKEIKIEFITSPDRTTSQFIQWAGYSVRQHSWEGSPDRLYAAIGETANFVIVDAYTASTAHFKALRPRAICLVAIDDLADRRLPVDVIVNVGAGTETLEYIALAHTKLLRGSRYALLDPAYADEPKRERDSVERVLVTLGGSVHPEALHAAIAAVDGVLEHVEIGVVPGPFASPDTAVEAVKTKRNRVLDYGHLPDLRPVMLGVDLAVTGAGVTLSEIAATATPAVMVLTEPNQARNVAAFEEAGAALFAGAAAEPGLSARIRAAVIQLAADADLRGTLGKAGRGLVDGQGARRVAHELVSIRFRGGN